jgi:16S rRNA (adenine1518-N6/adenine1519-N6)-dimethyltransferase
MPQKLGQHFLKNISALRLIAKTLDPQDGETVIEIGPGHGELTEQLLAANGQTHIIAIEKDSKLFALLKEKFNGNDRINIIGGDALKILPELIPDPNLKILNYKITGNIPYYITGHLLRVVSELKNRPECCVFTIQKEVAERICAEPPKMNRLAASVQYWAKPSIIKILPASDFNPKPKVASAIISLETKKIIGDAEDYYHAVRVLFAQPRKTIINNLAAGTDQKKEVISEKLLAIGMAPTSRPQDLSIENIVSITKRF